MDGKDSPAPTLDEMSSFLAGSGLLRGVLFGEVPHGERGQFWWRRPLADAVSQCKANESALREQVAVLLALLKRCRPVVESEMAMFDSMARHMAGGFPDEAVQSADSSADFHWSLLRDLDAAIDATRAEKGPADA